MKKLLVFITLLILANQISAQSKKYIEVRGTIDLMGNITLYLPAFSKEQKQDSVINFETIKQCFNKSTDAINVINRLENIGWHLLTVANINKDAGGRPNSEFIVYYFVKEF